MTKVNNPQLSSEEINSILAQTSQAENDALRQHAAVAGNLLLENGIDILTGSLELLGAIEEESFAQILRGLKLLEAAGHTHVTIFLNSGGGELYTGLAIYDTIIEFRRQGMEINIIGIGTVMSAAAVIFQAASLRILAPSAYMLLHYGSSSDSGEALTVIRGSKHYTALMKKMEKIFCDRSEKPRAQVAKWLARDTYFSAEDAVEANLADRILGDDDGMVES